MGKGRSIFCALTLSLWLFAQISFGQSFPQSVIREMATREMRYHHYLWHQVREGWNRFPRATQDAYRRIGWAPPRPARNYDANGRSSAILDNNSGEDFLYMHRQMIAKANEIITRNRERYGRITGWTTIPAPGDRQYPVPRTYTVPNNPSLTSSTNNRKTDSYYRNNILPNERRFKDPRELRRMTLGELGARIEVTIHGYLHMRFSSSSRLGYRNSYRGTIPYIDKRWDDISYDWLGDSYASHVNPIFWKIHGWVDDRIEDWRRANGLRSIRWRGTWTGGPMSNLSSVLRKSNMRGSMDEMPEEDGVGNLMEEALQLFLKSGVPEVTFADDVSIPETKVPKPAKVCKKRLSKKRLL